MPSKPSSPASNGLGRSRNPRATRQTILDAALCLLAESGPKGVSLVRVAQAAAVNRSTVYEYFRNCEDLIDRTRAWISQKLYRAVFADINTLGDRPFEAIDQIVLNDRLSRFAMDNPEACRVWLMQVLTLPDPDEDPFWAEYVGAVRHFSKTECAEDDVDPEVLAFIVLSSAFLWPTYVHNRASGARQLRSEAQRFLHETMRMGLYGTIKESCFPDVVRQVGEWSARRRAAVAAPVTSQHSSARDEDQS